MEAEYTTSLEPSSISHGASNNEHLAQPAESFPVVVVQDEIPIHQNAYIEEGEKLHSATSVTDDPVAGLSDELQCEAELQTDMPGTPTSLPSLASEPDDTCTPVKLCRVSPVSGIGELTVLAHGAFFITQWTLQVFWICHTNQFSVFNSV